MNRIEAFKVVEVVGDKHLSFLHRDLPEDMVVEYAIGRESRSSVGYLYAYRDLDDAELFARVMASGGHHYVIVSGVGDMVNQEAIAVSGERMGDHRDFWLNPEKVEHMTYPAVAAVYLSCFTPIEIVWRQE